MWAPSTAPSARAWCRKRLKEACRGVGFDLLLVCGFAFDPHVTDEAKRHDALTGPPPS